jgi:hypothetical protein
VAVVIQSDLTPEAAPLTPAGRATAGTDAGHLSPLELFAAAFALLLPVAYASGLEAETWSGRYALLLVVCGVGLPVLVSQTRGPRPLAARAAVAFVGIGCISAALSVNHTTAVFGLYGQGTGLLFMASLAAAWAIGRRIRPSARPTVEKALILGVGVNVAIALLAAVVDMPSSLAVNLFGDGGRSAALAGNPVHLAALAVLGLALIIPRFASARAAWAIPLAAMATAVQLSGTRLAIVVMVAMVLWAARHQGVRVGALVAALVVLGLAVGAAIGPSGVSATDRSAGPAMSGSWQPRVDTWLSARHGVVQRPLVGVGPGQFRTASSPYRSLAVAQREGPDRLFTDAHNLLVEYAVTTGLLGLGALIVWLVAATSQSHGWLLVGALGLLALHLFEPQSVVATPLAFLALGASASRGEARRRSRRALGWIVPALSLVAAVGMATVFLVGELDLQRGQFDLRLAPAQQAEQLLPAWPRPASLQAQAWLYTGIVSHHNQADYQISRGWRAAAVARDNADPALWNVLAELDEVSARSGDAGREYLAALRVNPTSARAMNGLARLAHQSCDFSVEQDWHQRALRVSTPGTSSAGPTRPRVEPAPACAGLPAA